MEHGGTIFYELEFGYRKKKSKTQKRSFRTGTEDYEPKGVPLGISAPQLRVDDLARIRCLTNSDVDNELVRLERWDADVQSWFVRLLRTNLLFAAKPEALTLVSADAPLACACRRNLDVPVSRHITNNRSGCVRENSNNTFVTSATTMEQPGPDDGKTVQVGDVGYTGPLLNLGVGELRRRLQRHGIKVPLGTCEKAELASLLDRASPQPEPDGEVSVSVSDVTAWPPWAPLPREEDVGTMSVMVMKSVLRRAQVETKELLTKDELRARVTATILALRNVLPADSVALTERWSSSHFASSAPAQPPSVLQSAEARIAWRDQEFEAYAASLARDPQSEPQSREERRRHVWMAAQRSHNVLFTRSYQNSCCRAEEADAEDEDIPALEPCFQASDGGDSDEDMCEIQIRERLLEEARKSLEFRQQERQRMIKLQEAQAAEDEKRRQEILEQVRVRKAQREEERRKKALQDEVREVWMQQVQVWKAESEAARKNEQGAVELEAKTAVKNDEGPETIRDDVAQHAKELESMKDLQAEEENRKEYIKQLRVKIYEEELQKLEEERKSRIEMRKKQRLAVRDEHSCSASGAPETPWGMVGMKCPRGHDTIPYLKRVSGPCDECKQNIPRGVQVMACSLRAVCDWFLCKRCSEDWDRKRQRETDASAAIEE